MFSPQLGRHSIAQTKRSAGLSEMEQRNLKAGKAEALIQQGVAAFHAFSNRRAAEAEPPIRLAQAVESHPVGANAE